MTENGSDAHRQILRALLMDAGLDLGSEQEAQLDEVYRRHREAIARLYQATLPDSVEY